LSVFSGRFSSFIVGLGIVRVVCRVVLTGIGGGHGRRLRLIVRFREAQGVTAETARERGLAAAHHGDAVDRPCRRSRIGGAEQGRDEALAESRGRVERPCLVADE